MGRTIADATKPSTDPCTALSSGDEMRIASVAIGAAHDGSAELVLRLVHANGVSEFIALDEATTARVLVECDIDDAQQLVNRSWRVLLAHL